MLMEITYGLSEKRLHEINELKDESKSAFIEKSSKSEYKYWLIVRLKAIKYKKDFFQLFSFLFLLPD